LPEIATVTYNGLSRDEHIQHSIELRSKFMEELARTSGTTTGVILGAAVGTGLAIGLSDEDAYSTVRISIDKDTTVKECNEFVKILGECLVSLKMME